MAWSGEEGTHDPCSTPGGGCELVDRRMSFRPSRSPGSRRLAGVSCRAASPDVQSPAPFAGTLDEHPAIRYGTAPSRTAGPPRDAIVAEARLVPDLRPVMRPVLEALEFRASAASCSPGPAAASVHQPREPARPLLHGTTSFRLHPGRAFARDCRPRSHRRDVLTLDSSRRRRGSPHQLPDLSPVGLDARMPSSSTAATWLTVPRR